MDPNEILVGTLGSISASFIDTLLYRIPQFRRDKKLAASVLEKLDSISDEIQAIQNKELDVELERIGKKFMEHLRGDVEQLNLTLQEIKEILMDFRDQLLKGNVTFMHDREAFVSQVEEIYRITGHEVQCSVIVGGKNIDIFAALPMTLGRPNQITYVQCIHHHQVTRDEMYDFRNALSDEKRIIGMMVSQYGFEPGALELAEEHGIVTMTYEQLVSEIIDFSSYLDKCIRDYEQQGVEHDVPLKKLYVEQDIIEDGTGKKYSLKNYVNDWLVDDTNLLVILGDFGIGKTSYTLKLASELVEKRKLENTGIIPVRIELKSYREAIDYEAMIISHLSDFKVNTTGYQAFDFLLRTGKVLLILDAFDEMAVQVNEEITKENFDELYKAVNGKSKVILTCRTHYFREHPEIESLIYDIHAPEGFRSPQGTALYKSISGRKNCRICFLQPFDNPQIAEYLRKALDEEKEKAQQILAKNKGLKDLANRPVLLAMIAQSFNDISKRGDIPSTTALYEVYIQKWIERDDSRTNLTKEGKEKLAEALAGKLWFESRGNTIHYSELRPLVEHHFKSRIRVPQDVEYAEHEVRTASFLTRDAEGNYGFAHRSFMEFFLARKFADEIKRNQIINFGMNVITEEVVDFLAGMITHESSLYRLIRDKTPDEVGYAGANMISILKRMNNDLSGRDFSNCILSYADLSYYSLAGADFSGAYMDGTNLSLYFFQNIALSSDGKYVVVAGSGVTVLDASDFSIVKEIKTRYWVRNVTYSPNEKYVVVGSGVSIGGDGVVTILVIVLPIVKTKIGAK